MAHDSADGVLTANDETTLTVAKIERVPLREVWRHEAYNLTTWLEQNIDVLNDVLDLELANVEREQAAGSFSADLVAEDTSGGTASSNAQTTTIWESSSPTSRSSTHAQQCGSWETRDPSMFAPCRG